MSSTSMIKVPAVATAPLALSEFLAPRDFAALSVLAWSASPADDLLWTAYSPLPVTTSSIPGRKRCILCGKGSP